MIKKFRITSIRCKIILSLAFLFIAGSLLSYVLLQKIILPSFINLEKQEAINQIERVVNAIKGVNDNIDTLCHDWSAWDDAYFFMEDLNKVFVISNLEDSSLTTVNLNLLLFFNPQGKVIYANEINFLTGEQVRDPDFPTENVPVELFDLLTNFDNVPIDEAKVTGLYVVGKNIYILSCRPILTSDGEGPANGYMVMAQLYTDSLQAELQKKINADFTSHQGGRDLNHQLFAEAYQLADKAIYLDPVDNDVLYALAEIPGINQQTALTIKIAIARQIIKQGKKTIRTSILAILAVGCLTLLLIVIAFHLLIHQPLTRLASHALKISDDSDLSRRLALDTDYRNDEIGDLAREFNDMLDTIEFSHAQMDEINEQQEMEIIRRKQLERDLLETQKKLENLATIDELTQIANRRVFNDEFGKQWLLHLRQQRPLAIILCDVDHFKFYNDTYGHPAGDSCLQRVARLLAESVQRPSDLAARYGGEEFIVMLPETLAAEAEKVAENIRAAVEKCKIEHSASPVASHITLSLGVAALVPREEMKPEELVLMADKALYQAKEQGRNRVVLA